MGKGGRPRKSLGAHVQDGTYKPCDHDGRGVDVEGMPMRPRGLNNTQRWLWDLITTNLPAECFGRIDAVALRQACDFWDIWQKGKNSKDRTEFYKAIAAAKELRQIMSGFGWTPADRARLNTPKKPKEEEDKFFGMVG